MISVIIPTYKRKKSLIRLLNSIINQTLLPSEIIVVTSAYSKNDLQEINNLHHIIKVLKSSPSVCKQRNIGINYAKSKYILLCDDDIELPNSYLESLLLHFNNNKNVKIVTGKELQINEKGKWSEVKIKMTHLNLIYCYIFGISICSDLSKFKTSKNIIIQYIFNYYKKKGNSISKSGWPIITEFSYPIMKTSIYGLGCSMIERKILLKNLYNENLDKNGIGDNYEVSMKINGLENKIDVIRNVPYYHFKDKNNRYENHMSYFKRGMSLYSFLNDLPFFKLKNKIYFIWSLIGNEIIFLKRKDLQLLKSNHKLLCYSFLKTLKP